MDKNETLKKWEKGTFDSVKDFLRYHSGEHVKEVGEREVKANHEEF